MSLSKQLYLMITLIFLALFVGNTIISIKNTKEYLQMESTTKASDTATALGMMIKPYIKDKNDPEIRSIINAVSDSGFYEEIRLENAFYSFNNKNIIDESIADNYEILDLKIKNGDGILVVNNDKNIENELMMLENDSEKSSLDNESKTYLFTPNTNFKDGDSITITYNLKDNGQLVSKESKIKLSKVLFQSSRDTKFSNVPQWFIDILPLHLSPQSSEISDGWKTAAIIFVSPNGGIAYSKLYEQIKSLLIYTTIAFAIVMLLLTLFIKLILKPLKTIENLANKISNGYFEQIEKLPWTTELKTVSLAINGMSLKIKNMITKLTKDVENVSKKLELDGLTNLPIKHTFDVNLKESFVSKQSGHIFFIKISNLKDYAIVNSTHETDKLLIDFATILSNVKNSKAYRFYGAEFALITLNTTNEEVLNITKSLKLSFEELGEKISNLDIANIGISSFDSRSNITNVISVCNEAYEMAKQIGPNEAYLKEAQDDGRNKAQWGDLICDIVDNFKFEMNYIGDIKDVKNSKTIIQEAFASIYDDNNKEIPIGTFVSIAEERNKIVDFDKAVILKVISNILDNNIQHKISINLSFDSIQDISFVNWLTSTINQKSSIANKLVFSLTAYSIAKYTNNFNNFVRIIQKNGSEIMIKRFESKFIAIENLKDINPNCIRLARDYTTDINFETNKQMIVDSIIQISKLYNIKVYAESVTNELDYNFVSNLGIDGASKWQSISLVVIFWYNE